VCSSQYINIDSPLQHGGSLIKTQNKCKSVTTNAVLLRRAVYMHIILHENCHTDSTKQADC